MHFYETIHSIIHQCAAQPVADAVRFWRHDHTFERGLTLDEYPLLSIVFPTDG